MTKATLELMSPMANKRCQVWMDKLPIQDPEQWTD